MVFMVSLRDIKRTTCDRGRARATGDEARIARRKPAARNNDRGRKSRVGATRAHEPGKPERTQQACELPPVERRLAAAAQHTQAADKLDGDDVPARC